MVYRSKWKPEDKIRIVMESINTISTSELCRQYGVVPTTFYQKKERFKSGKLGLSGALKNGDASRQLESESERLKKLIGELTTHRQRLSKKAMEGEEKMTAIQLILEGEKMSPRTVFR